MEDWWESDFQAFFNGTLSTMSLQCLENTTVFSISLENYKSLCIRFQTIQDFMLWKSNLGFIAAQQRILSLLKDSAKERYERLLNQYPRLLQRIPKSQVALYLGVSRETLSRISQ